MSEIVIKECMYCKRKKPLNVVLKTYSEERVRIMCKHCGHEMIIDKNKKGTWE